MILKEQIHKQKSKTYWHGSRTNNLNKNNSAFNEFFMTTDEPYAYYMAEKDPDATIFKCYLKTPINIFNAKSTVDRFILKKNIGISDEELDFMNSSDWILKNEFFDNFTERNILIEKIKSIGYKNDLYKGFFNFEWTGFPWDNEGKWYKKDYVSVGIFDIDYVIVADKIPAQKFKKRPAVQEEIKKEKEKVKLMMTSNILKNNSNINEGILKTWFINQKEIDDIKKQVINKFKDVDIEEYKSNLEEKRKLSEQTLRRYNRII